jgi:hypothetical protein
MSADHGLPYLNHCIPALSLFPPLAFVENTALAQQGQILVQLKGSLTGMFIQSF